MSELWWGGSFAGVAPDPDESEPREGKQLILNSSAVKEDENGVLISSFRSLMERLPRNCFTSWRSQRYGVAIE